MNPDCYQQSLLKLMLRFVRFPYPKACVHFVALELLSELELNGFQVPKELAKSLSECSNGDQTSERILLELLNQQQ